MNTTEFDRDEILTDFLCDYVEGDLDEGERSSFEDYLDNNAREKKFAGKVLAGKKALNMFAEHFDRVSTAP